eukprot:3390252-Alexandrium_andersonii.AAC.1
MTPVSQTAHSPNTITEWRRRAHQIPAWQSCPGPPKARAQGANDDCQTTRMAVQQRMDCLLYTSDAADDM